MRFQRGHAAQEQIGVAAELVHDEARDHRSVVGRERDLRSENLGENPAPVDVADKRDRTIRGAGKAHVGNVALAQVDLGRAARAFDEHNLGGLFHPAITLEHRAHQFRFQRLIFARPRIADRLALDDDLRADFALGLEQHRVHVHAWARAAGARLKRLGAADLAAVIRHGGVVRHVLRLEWTDAEPASCEGAAESGDNERLADVRTRALKHARARAQNSIPSCARTPAAK